MSNKRMIIKDAEEHVSIAKYFSNMSSSLTCFNKVVKELNEKIQSLELKNVALENRIKEMSSVIGDKDKEIESVVSNLKEAIDRVNSENREMRTKLAIGDVGDVGDEVV